MLQIQKNKGIIQKVNKLDRRIKQLRQCKKLFMDYLYKASQLYGKNVKLIKGELDVFEENLVKKAFLSLNKCKQMKSMIDIFRQYCSYIETNAKVNMSELKQVNYESTEKEKKLSEQANNFVKEIGLYMNEESAYNKLFELYDGYCSKMDELIHRFRSYEDPIKFYNLTMAGQFSQKFDKKYQQCEKTQTMVVSNLQVLDQKRKLLLENVHEIKQGYLYLLQEHLIDISKSADKLVDSNKDQMYEKIKSNKNIENMQPDVFSEDIQRLNDKYAKNEQQCDELLHDLTDLFGTSSSIQISSDYKLFLDRCETFRDKKNQSIEETMFIQKKFVKHIDLLISCLATLEKQFNSLIREIFRSNGIDNYKKKFRTYFGENFINIAELCFTIIENPQKKFNKIHKQMVTKQEKLKKILHKKEEQVKKFRKRVNIILDDHHQTKQTLDQKSQMNIAIVTKFKNSVEKSFLNFRDIFKEFLIIERDIDQSFNQEIRQLSDFIHKQYSHSLLAHILGKDKEKNKLELLKKKNNVQYEVICIIKEDDKYDVLFNDPLPPELFGQFHSKMDKSNYEQTKKVIQKKQVQSRALMGQKRVGCCGLTQNLKFKSSIEHPCSLIVERKLRVGYISISKKGFAFDEKGYNFFQQKISIMVPNNQINSYQLKTNEEGEGFQILTNMGPIYFNSEDSKRILDSFQKQLPHRLSRGKNDSNRRDKLNDSSSSFMKGNSSTEFKVSFDSSFVNPTSGRDKDKRKNSQKKDSHLIKDLIDAWKGKKLLSENFEKVNSKEAGKHTVRQDFNFKEGLKTFLLKQKRSVHVSGPRNCVNFDYEWKVSFPDNPTSRSFRHSQVVRLQIQMNPLKILIIQKPHSEDSLYLRKKFYTQIDQMNRNLCDFFAEQTEKEGEVLIEIEKLSQQEDLNLDLKQLMLEGKDQILNKSGRFSKIATNSQFNQEDSRLKNSH